MPKVKRPKKPPIPTTSRTARTCQTAPQDENGPHSGSGVCCRVCMRWDSESMMVQLFAEHSFDSSLAEVLAIVGGVEVSEGDRLPQVCCVRCRQDVEAAFKLRTLCQTSDGKLRELHCEQVVVKEECDDDELLNPLGMEGGTVCKPDVATLFLFQQEENDDEEPRILPKVEIFDEEPAESSYLMESDQDDDLVKHEEDDAEDFDSDCSDKEENTEDDAKASTSKSFIRKYPDVFETIHLGGARCCGCKEMFNTEQELFIHSQTAHIDRKTSPDLVKNQCEICFKVFGVARTLKNHKQLVTSKCNFRCKTCGEIFPSRKGVCAHYGLIHALNSKTDSQTCCGCTQTFETKEALKTHSDEVHSLEKLPPNPERPVVCEICYRNFATVERLQQHRVRQTRVRTKNLQCIECGKAFERPGQLRNHEVSHRGEKIFQCPHCPKTYSHKDTFRKHVYSHTAPKSRYQCNICGRYQKSKGTLKEHMLIHTGERPLECPHCPATFARDDCRKSHIRYTHLGERNHACELCDKRFTTNVEKERHVKFYHEKQKPYPCFFCTRAYPRKDYRKRHMVSAHPNEMRANPIPASELGEGKYELPPE